MTRLGGALRVHDMYLSLKPLADSCLWIAPRLFSPSAWQVDRGQQCLDQPPQEEVLSWFLVMERQEPGPAL